MKRRLYESPRLAVDLVVFGFDEGALKVLLIRRGLDPFEARWALPGGFVRMEESVDEAARRELAEETGLSGVFLEQLYTFGEPQRDPSERVVSVTYYALVKLGDHQVRASTDAQDVAWFPVSAALDLPLPFDHRQILQVALERLKGKVSYQPIGFELLPVKFTLSQLQHLYEAVLEQPLDKRNFRKKILSMGLLTELGETEQGVAHRAARLYRFNTKKYEQLKRRGINFEL